eukprot:jgi/Orpsp1_1/1175977/evm.model.c7180000055925.1
MPISTFESFTNKYLHLNSNRKTKKETITKINKTSYENVSKQDKKVALLEQNRNKKPVDGPILSERALEIQHEEFLLSKGIIIVRNNKYHPETNPNGIINLGTAENKLNNVEMTSKINDPKVSTVTAEQLLYGPNPGSDRLREEVAELLNHLPDPENTHGLWGFSKDFCLNGLRIGVTISYSETVMTAMQKICFLTCIPTNIDNILVNILSDKEWTDNFILNNNRKLYKNYTHFTKSLNAHHIPYVEGDSGFFIYIDLHQAGLNEYDLWMKLLEGGVYISPSQAFFAKESEEERNWFRVCFAVEQEELNLSLDRLYKVLDTIEHNKQNK